MKEIIAKVCLFPFLWLLLYFLLCIVFRIDLVRETSQNAAAIIYLFVSCCAAIGILMLI